MPKQRDLLCKECNGKYVVNKHFCLCDKCNFKRLHNGKGRDEIRLKPIKHASNKRSGVLLKDHETYLKLFNSSNHLCEECNTPLPDEFEDENGIIAIWRYSHILPKSTYPEYRHDVRNFNHLCLSCHSKWEFGDKKTMNIYEKNKDIIYELKQKR